jgi:predicted TIM-barrel fold metal-dependent hydrolase
MSKPNDFPVVDADAHVLETERTWDYLEPAEEKYRPQLYSTPDNPRQYWVVDGKIAGFRFLTLSERELKTMSEKIGRNVETPQASRELHDVELRLKHMDELGIDIQVLHNTMWIEQVSQHPDVEAALCRSWNRWLGDIWRQSQGRLRWSCVVPTMLIDEAIAQVKTAKQNGAVAVCLRPLEEGRRHLTDPYFYPLYETADHLDMAIAVHIANGNRDYCDLYRSTPASPVPMFRVPTVAACFSHLMSEVPQLFPKLRWGFIEASAEWIPWIYREVEIRYRATGRKFSKDLFREYNVYVTCQTNDDIPHILNFSGEHRLVIGTDYGHTDSASEVDAIAEFNRLEGISPAVKERILCHNPKTLYAL